MLKKKILTIFFVVGLSIFSLGCTKTTNIETNKTYLKEVTSKINHTEPMEEILLDYSEEGISLMKKLFPDKTVMDIALKNIGKELPEMSFKTMDGKTINTKDLKNKKVVIEVVQSTCSICKDTSKILEDSKDLLKDTIKITIFPKDNNQDIENFYKDLKINKPENIVSLENNKNLNIIKEFNLKATPSLLFIQNNLITNFSMGNFDQILLKDKLNIAFNSEKKLYDYLRIDTIEVNTDDVVIASSNPIYKDKKVSEIKDVTSINDKLEKENKPETKTETKTETATK